MDITSYLLGKKTGGGGGLNWSEIGYDGTPQAIIDGYDYAKQIQTNWTQASDLSNKFANDKNLTYFPLVDTSDTTNMYYMFSNCSSLQTIALIDTSNVITASSMFSNCYGLKEIPQIDTSKFEGFNSMFNNCYSLKEVPQFDASSVYGRFAFRSMFSNCMSLSDESLNNILGTCIGAINYTGTKKLAELGVSSTYYSDTTIQALPNYQAFLNAGWAIGF